MHEDSRERVRSVGYVRVKFIKGMDLPKINNREATSL
jgi:hypothetical protein